MLYNIEHMFILYHIKIVNTSDFFIFLKGLFKNEGDTANILAGERERTQYYNKRQKLLGVLLAEVRGTIKTGQKAGLYTLHKSKKGLNMKSVDLSKR